MFMGTAVLPGCLTVAGSWVGVPTGWTMMLAGSIAYLVGNVGVTMGFNVPMNDALAAADPNAPGSATLWATSLDRWVFWNHVRAAACTGALAAFAMAVK